MKNLLFALAIVSFVYSCDKEITGPGVPPLGELRGYNDIFVGDFRCGVFIPPGYDASKKYPLILRLHGYTDTTTWPLEWYSEPWVSKDPSIVITPKYSGSEPGGWGHSWQTELSPHLRKAFDVVEQIEKDFSVDKDRYYVYGTSMVGYGTFAALMYFPDKFAAAYIECGNGNPKIAPIVAQIPCWMFHGSEDDVVPVQGARDMYQAVLAVGGTRIRYTEYEGVGHNTWDYTKNETTLNTWFLAHKKGVTHNPPVVSLAPVKITNPDNSVTISWSVPDAYYPVDDNSIWYVRVYKNGTALAEVYNNQNSYTDENAQNSDTYQVLAVNYYFLESELSPSLK